MPSRVNRNDNIWVAGLTRKAMGEEKEAKTEQPEMAAPL
jgi:hypothetical protein